MKLSNYIIDLGRVVAYYPNLKKITDSTTSSILLCQLLYWCDKTRDQWIWKTSDDIEEETGLTYNEQRTARKNLVDLGIVTEEYKRLDHMYRFRVNQEILNSMWEGYTGKKSEAIVPKIKKSTSNQPEHVYKQDTTAKTTAKVSTKAKDTADEDKKLKIKQSIKEKIEKKLNITADDLRWSKFIDFVYDKQENNSQPIETFIDWAIKEGFNPIYWTPEKMKTVYPQAFIVTGKQQASKSFVKKLPKREQEEFAPMPKDIGRKKNLY